MLLRRATSLHPLFLTRSGPCLQEHLAEQAETQLLAGTLFPNACIANQHGSYMSGAASLSCDVMCISLCSSEVELIEERESGAVESREGMVGNRGDRPCHGGGPEKQRGGAKASGTRQGPRRGPERGGGLIDSDSLAARHGEAQQVCGSFGYCLA